MNSFDGLIEKGVKLGTTTTTQLGKSFFALVDKVYSLKPNGGKFYVSGQLLKGIKATALGPSLAIAVGIAQKAPGSKIMVSIGD